MPSRRHFVVAACLVFIPFIIWQFVVLTDTISAPTQWPATICSAILPVTSKKTDTLAVPQKRHHVAVASTFGFHFDVYMALVWTLERVMGNNQSGGGVQVYAPLPFGFNFSTIVENQGLYHGDVKNFEALVQDLNSNQGEGGIDLVVLGTCEFDLRNGQPWREELLAAWDARDAAHKFKLVCIVHNVNDIGWQTIITPWAQRNAIRILPISEHVAAAFRRSFKINADSPDESVRMAGYEYIPVDVHVPILDIPVAVDHRPSRILSDAVIQGSFYTDRRDYLEIFTELNESLARDPTVWGYLPLGNEEDAAYVVDESLSDPPFRLFLIGSGWLQIPHELEKIVLIRDGLSYPDFYALMSKMDICVTAFSADHGYYDAQASSTFAMAVECNVPLLVTERIKASYTYVNDDRAVVTRPAAMREVEALRALRTRDASYFLRRTGIALDSPKALAAEAMLRLGWERSAEEARAFKEGIWRANEAVVERILRDL
ncbi:hypothetical protein C8R46DRAFT_1109642 [Mycena filopes]|nr:hypothetical protein C8R46DRAFT_1109642 [Mycena filopes]